MILNAADSRTSSYFNNNVTTINIDVVDTQSYTILTQSTRRATLT